jgi:hypothetical protein
LPGRRVFRTCLRVIVPSIDETKGEASLKNGNETVKDQIKGLLTQGKSKLLLMEHRIMDEKNGEKIKVEFEKTKKNLLQLRKKFLKYGEKAVHYTEKNPKKALALASAAGVMVTALWIAFRKKK